MQMQGAKIHNLSLTSSNVFVLVKTTKHKKDVYSMLWKQDNTNRDNLCSETQSSTAEMSKYPRLNQRVQHGWAFAPVDISVVL